MLSYQFERCPDLRVLLFGRVSVQIDGPYPKKEARCKKLSWHLTLSSPRECLSSPGIRSGEDLLDLSCAITPAGFDGSSYQDMSDA